MRQKEQLKNFFIFVIVQNRKIAKKNFIALKIKKQLTSQILSQTCAKRD